MPTGILSPKEEIMKTVISILIALSFIFAAPAFAKKPSWAGKGKHSESQFKNHGKTMQSQAGDEIETTEENLENATEGKKIGKKGKKDHKTMKDEALEEGKPGLEKQGEKKSEQLQKELDKGSEKGQESRQKRKKWWKFGE